MVTPNEIFTQRALHREFNSILEEIHYYQNKQSNQPITNAPVVRGKMGMVTEAISRNDVKSMHQLSAEITSMWLSKLKNN